MKITDREAKDLLIGTGRRAMYVREYGWDLGERLLEIRRQLITDLTVAHSKFHNPGNVNTYLVIFDGLVARQQPVNIARKLGMSRERMGQLIAKLRRYPAMKVLFSRLNGIPS